MTIGTIFAIGRIIIDNRLLGYGLVYDCQMICNAFVRIKINSIYQSIPLV